MLATWLGSYASILFPAPFVSKTRLLRNLLIDYCEFGMLQVENTIKCITYGMHVIRCVCSFSYQPPMQLARPGKLVIASGGKNCSLHL